jgi:hypothetical protein
MKKEDDDLRYLKEEFRIRENKAVKEKDAIIAQKDKMIEVLLQEIEQLKKANIKNLN